MSDVKPMTERCGTCRTLLAEGLDLCVRARNMDARDRRQATLQCVSDPEGWLESGMFDEHVKYHNEHNLHAPIATRSATVYLWEQDQYERDLAEWEKKGRNHLLHELCPVPLPPSESDSRTKVAG